MKLIHYKNENIIYITKFGKIKIVMKNFKLISLIFVLLSAISCIDEYEYSAENYDSVLAIQGIVTDTYESTEVILSRSLKLSSEEFIVETDAIVFVTDTKGDIILFTEIKPGIYKPTDTNFSGILNNEYFLTVQTKDGSEYISDIVTLNPVPEIDSIYHIYSETYSFEEEKYIKGVDICIDTKWDEESELYLRWDYIETIKFWQKWETNDLSNSPYSECWQTKYNENVLVEETSIYDNDAIERYPIAHFSEYDYEPQYGLSILVRQHSINESVYKFWEMLKENSEENGNVFAGVPYSPVSNITCTDSDKKVHGYFDASCSSEKRFYLIAPVYDIPFTDINDDCVATAVNYEVWRDLDNVYVISSEDNVVYTRQRECVDCSAYERSQRTKPDFWDYN
jgi:hypothetical protein